MKKHSRRASSDQGFTLVYLAVVISGVLIFSGLAVDSGRAYAVKAQLTKAVDGAALGAARNLNSGDPSGEATRIFHANFPPGFMGTSAVDPAAAPGFFTLTTDASTGVNTITINASATLPTTFMRLGNINSVTVSSLGQATRRMVDLSLVLDVSSSIGSQWPTVRDAARTFIDSFDAAHDRLSLLTFSNGATVLDPMPSTRGFDKTHVEADVPQTLPGGSTLMVEGLYRGWDELRSVPNGTQSSLRIIVLFTDGASNGVPANYPSAPGIATSLRTYDFPQNANDPDGQTWNSPQIVGLFDTQSGGQNPVFGTAVPWNSTTTLAQAPFLPATTWHTHHRSAGIPTSFPLQTNTLTVNGAPQDSRRGLRHFNAAQGQYPAEVWNINNAARNVLEIIANQARNDAGGDYPVRIYTIGMSYLVRDLLGTMPEMPEDILKRIANDITSPDFNEAQLEGKYFYAQTAADVAPAFQGIQNQILRLTR
jgi:Flp pilus assembly protein TadG